VSRNRITLRTSVSEGILYFYPHLSSTHRRRPGAEFGGRKKFRRPKFLNDVFKKKISIFTAEISDDFFIVDHVFQIFHIFTVWNVVYDPFFTRKIPVSENNSFMAPFFTLFILSHASEQHYFSKYWGDRCMGRPPPQFVFLGAVPLSPPRFPSMPPPRKITTDG